MVIEQILIYGALIVLFLGPAVMIAFFTRAFIKASARNPSASLKMMIWMLLLLLIVTSISIYLILIVFRLFR